MPRLEVPGATVHYRTRAPAGTAGSDGVFVLLHGWGCDSSDWEDLVDPLAAGRQVLTVDLRGFGGSRATDGDFSLPAVAGDVEGLLDHLHAGRAVLVGHSAGAEVAALIAVRRPDLVAALVCVDPAYGLPEQARARVRDFAEQMQRGEPVHLAAGLFDQLDAPTTARVLVERHRRTVRRADPQALCGLYTQFAFGPQALHFRPRTDQVLAARRVPLLAVYRNDARAQIGREFIRREADRVLSYPGCGHWPHQEHPDRFAADVHAWLLECP